MKHPLVGNTQEFIEHEALFTPNDKLLLAVSGGIDSVCLAFVLRELGYQFDLAHVNFQLRGAASDGDQAFVERLAEQLGVKLRLQSSHAKHKLAESVGKGLQETARDLRYHFFAQLASKENYDYVITAHHLEDNLETTLLNLMRGTGIIGLTGIPAKRGVYRRPFLTASRYDIESYAAANAILWREDASNASDVYRRNQVRHHVVPALKTIDPHWDQQLRSSYHYLRNDRKLFQFAVQQAYDNLLDKDGNIIRAKLPDDQSIAEHLLKHCLTKFGFAGDQFRQLLEAQTGTLIFANPAPSPSANQPVHSIEVTSTLLVLRSTAEDAVSTVVPTPLLLTTYPATLKFSAQQSLRLTEIPRPEEVLGLDSNVALLSPSTTPLPWLLRHPMPGDRFQPFGLGGKSKKLQDYFTDIKLPRSEREKQWLLCDNNGAILWILGLRMSEIGRVKMEDKKVVKAVIVKIE